MNAKAIAFYGMGAGLLLAGLIIGCCSGFDSSAWWPVITGAVLGGVGALVQFGIIDIPVTKK